jgi:hypothetical protein
LHWRAGRRRSGAAGTGRYLASPAALATSAA